MLALTLWPARGAAEPAKPDLSLKRETLADGIYLFRAPSALDLWTSSNSVVVVGKDDVTVFDTNTRAKTARLVIDEIRKLTDKPVRTVVNSHWHMDHWGGNDEYAKAFPGVRIVATAETRRYMEVMGPKFFSDETGYEKSKKNLETAIATGKKQDGTPMTAEVRRFWEKDLAETKEFSDEIEALPRLLPNLVYEDKMTFWSGGREFRLISATGDATGSTVLYLPAEKILVMGDVLPAPESGDGPLPWTTNSYAMTPWLESLRRIDALDADVVVPGQGPAFHDKAYLKLTIEVFASVIEQVRAALKKGQVTLTDIQAAVNADALGRKYKKDGSLTTDFPLWVKTVAKKAHQEAVDGAASTR